MNNIRISHFHTDVFENTLAYALELDFDKNKTKTKDFVNENETITNQELQPLKNYYLLNVTSN